MSLIAANPLFSSELQQRRFRALLHAMSYPGEVLDLAPHLAGERSALGILACLVDETTTLADPDRLLSTSERGLLKATCVPTESADFVLVNAREMPRPDFRPKLGDLYRPDTSTTMVLAGQSVGTGPIEMRLTGPGVKTETRLLLEGFDPSWFAARNRWVANFPLGVDLLLCDSAHVAAIPRTAAITLHRVEPHSHRP